MVRGNKIYADATEENMYASIDALADKLDRCVKKHKEKAADHHAEEVLKARCSPGLGLRMSMRLIIVSGLSGSGKSVALHMLEDIDFYCVDNIPAALLKPFISHTSAAWATPIRGPRSAWTRAIGPTKSKPFPPWSGELRRSGIGCEVLYLHAAEEVLLKRYAETRRKHPLVTGEVGLREAIASERRLLEPITTAADLGDRHLQHGRPRTARADSRAHRPPARGTAVADVRVLRLQARHSRRCGLRVRRAQPAESLLGARAAHLTGRDAAVIEYLDGHRQRAQHDRRSDRVPGKAHRRILAGEPQLSDHRDRLHRRPASLGVHRRAARRAFSQRPIRRC